VVCSFGHERNAKTKEEVIVSEGDASWDGLAERRLRVEQKVAGWCRDKSCVDDVVQETMIRAARYRSGLREEQRIDPWIDRIAWNVLKSHLSREARRGISLMEHAELDVAEGREEDPEIQLVEAVHWVSDMEVESCRLAALLEGAIRALPDHERRMIRAAYTQQMSPAAIGELFGVRRALVKSRLYRIRQKLRRRVLQALGGAQC